MKKKFKLSVRLTHFGGYRTEVEAESLEAAIAKETREATEKGWIVEAISERHHHAMSDTELAALHPENYPKSTLRAIGVE